MKSSPREWTRIELDFDPSEEDRVFEVLAEEGAIGWESGDSWARAYFEPSEKGRPGDAVSRALGREVREETVTDAGWREAWRSHIRPVRVAGIIVSPPWSVPPPEGGEIIIVIEPGMAFGTGGHETTKACLGFIRRHAAPASRFLDLGSGSGVLSIAASRLGSSVLALDMDPKAVAETKRNAEANHLEMEARLGGIESLAAEETFDLIAANIEAATLIPLAPEILGHLDPEGFLILAGILTEEEDEVSRAYAEAGFEIVSTVIEGKWSAIEMKPVGP